MPQNGLPYFGGKLYEHKTAPMEVESITVTID